LYDVSGTFKKMGPNVGGWDLCWYEVGVLLLSKMCTVDSDSSVSTKTFIIVVDPYFVMKLLTRCV
jgi:hypothetical protein